MTQQKILIIDDSPHARRAHLADLKTANEKRSIIAGDFSLNILGLTSSKDVVVLDLFNANTNTYQGLQVLSRLLTLPKPPKICICSGEHAAEMRGSVALALQKVTNSGNSASRRYPITVISKQDSLIDAVKALSQIHSSNVKEGIKLTQSAIQNVLKKDDKPITLEEAKLISLNEMADLFLLQVRRLQAVCEKFAPRFNFALDINTLEDRDDHTSFTKARDKFGNIKAPRHFFMNIIKNITTGVKNLRAANISEFGGNNEIFQITQELINFCTEFHDQLLATRNVPMTLRMIPRNIIASIPVPLRPQIQFKIQDKTDLNCGSGFEYIVSELILNSLKAYGSTDGRQVLKVDSNDLVSVSLRSLTDIEIKDSFEIIKQLNLKPGFIPGVVEISDQAGGFTIPIEAAFREHVSTRGTAGLGLDIVREFCEKNNFNLQIYSDSKGSTVRIILPIIIHPELNA